MTVSGELVQDPAPGAGIIAFPGDTRRFRLTLTRPGNGAAWIRTNVGHAAITRREIIEKVRFDRPALGKDWYDIPMRRISEREFEITLPLSEVGHFEAKCFYLETDRFDPLWPEGPNTVLNVKPAELCGSNVIYNAFVRQFGPNKDGSAAPTPEESACVSRLDSLEYTVIPKSGTFRDLIRELDFIFHTLGCRILHLLPIHPTPTTYARMGRFGSPYASLSFTAVDPALAQFDPKATPLDQFIELVDAVHARSGKLIIDIAPNHTGWAATLHETHPHWLARDPGGNIEVPGAWGVRWEDLTRLDYSHKELWDYMADVFLTWCRRGVDGFRCDAGYMIPVEAWRFIVAVVREQYPDTIFLLEGLGGKISVARDILNVANFDWAYSELFQNYDRSQIEYYLPGAIEISQTDGLLVHYAETHDNNRLAARSHAWAHMRTALCALFSHMGGFGFANGVEWLATEKIIVHESPSLNWGNPVNQIEWIRRLNRILKNHPTFRKETRLQLVQTGEGNHAALLRVHEPSGKRLLVVVNLSDTDPVKAQWKHCLNGKEAVDLLSGSWQHILEEGDHQALVLSAAQVLCLSTDAEDLKRIDAPVDPDDTLRRQTLKALALDIRHWLRGIEDVHAVDLDSEIRMLAADPSGYCTRVAGRGEEPILVPWNWPEDRNRIVLVPHGHGLWVRSEHAFRVRLQLGERTLFEKNGIPNEQGAFFAVLPIAPGEISRTLHLRMTVYERSTVHHADADILCLSDGKATRIPAVLHRKDIVDDPPLFLATNGRGGMCRASVAWTALPSRYDALLAANLHPDVPEDRRMLFTRCRGWVIFQGFSQEICVDSLDAFRVVDGTGYWRFHLPSGQGEHIVLTVGLRMIEGENRIEISFFRNRADGRRSTLPDTEPVQLVLRPDIEDRSFHETTKAYLGPEFRFPSSVTPIPEGFRFHPESDHFLELTLSEGEFHIEPQWQYMVYRPVEAERGLDPHSDLFSPGYFTTVLRGGEERLLVAEALRSTASPSPAATEAACSPPDRKKRPSISEIRFDEASRPDPSTLMTQGLSAYIVRRKPYSSIIAGYPWFLDWGRDSLIFVRGLAAAGQTTIARKVLLQFGRFEEHGTLPNMIAGEHPANRDTSDAPLWFVIAVRDCITASQKPDFLDAPCGQRTIRAVLISILQAYQEGTPNGIRMDPGSGLIYSPAHFTWMDTNHPACSPRQGYPIEIQALWHAALQWMAAIDEDHRSTWQNLAQRVRTSIDRLFWDDDLGHLSDCRHADRFVPAADAQADDALRPNQLLAVTLDAVSDISRIRSIVCACRQLLVPGGIRSLADRPVRRPITIQHHGRPLGDPHRPYRGRYTGDEDTSRKPAYHNGTAWGWMFPAFCEAWVRAWGPQAKATALSYLGSSIEGLMKGCIGHLPEIVDGDAPHTPRGCDAQAWSLSETVRVWMMLEKAAGLP